MEKKKVGRPRGYSRLLGDETFEEKQHRLWREGQARWYKLHKKEPKVSERLRKNCRRYYVLHIKKVKKPDPEGQASGTDEPMVCTKGATKGARKE